MTGATGPDLIYLSYGSAEQQRVETRFAVLSALRRGARMRGRMKIVVYTDAPEALSDLPIECRLLDARTLDAWRGPQRYQHRIKAQVVRDALSRCESGVIFVDSDTWVRRDLEPLWHDIRTGSVVMHMREGRAADSADPKTSRLAQQLEGESIRLPSGRTLALESSLPVWNSGVLGLDGRHAGSVDDAIALIDWIVERFPGSPTAEQLAFSAVIPPTRIRAASGFVYHYWHPSVREPAIRALPAALHDVRHLSVAEQADALHAHRPRARGATMWRAWLRRGARAVGAHPSTIRSNAT